ncbi:hypothetical protein SAMN04487890_104270 [Mucilaginibacter polytrichastri]|nr:hypothetical protein SAMN04487890_104270 [Mucilaginibacter polytrichastri]
MALVLNNMSGSLAWLLNINNVNESYIKDMIYVKMCKQILITDKGPE